MIKGVIFDCDGVLFESRQANLAYYNEVLAFFGELPVTEVDKAKADLCHTAASPEVFASLLGEERKPAALEMAATIDYRKFIPDMIPEPGLLEALVRLSEQFPLAIATNRGGSMLEILDHFDLARFFTAVVTSRDVVRPKPHPDMLLLAVEKLGMAVTDLLFVGDSIYDLAAAGSAGMQFASYKSLVDTPIKLESHTHLVTYVQKTNQSAQETVTEDI